MARAKCTHRAVVDVEGVGIYQRISGVDDQSMFASGRAAAEAALTQFPRYAQA